MIELMVSMFIFLLMMGVMARYFTAANQIWRSTAKKNEIYSNARVAMDLIARDIQGVLYNNDLESAKGIYPVWHKGASGAFGEMLNFVAYTPLKPDKDAVSSICEIRYSTVSEGQTLIVGSTTLEEFDLIRSSVGDNNEDKYNFSLFPRCTYDSVSGEYKVKDYYTANSKYRIESVFEDSSSGDWQRVIKYVVDLKFEFYYYDATSYTTEKSTKFLDLTDSFVTNSDKDKGDNLPNRIRIVMSIIDKATYLKYKKIAAADKADFLKDNKLTFFRTVYFSKRESY